MTPMPSWLLRVALAAYPRGVPAATSAPTWRDGLHSRVGRPGDGRQRWHRLVLIARTVGHGLAERGAAVVRLSAGAATGRISTSPPGRRAGMWDGLAARPARGGRALVGGARLHGAGGGGAGPRHRRQRRDLRRRQRRTAQAAALSRRRSAGRWSGARTRRPAARPTGCRPPTSPTCEAMSRSFSAIELRAVVRHPHRDRRPTAIRACCTSRGSADGMLDAARRARPQLGRAFGAGERDVAVLSDAAWRGRFGADPGDRRPAHSLLRQRNPRDRRGRRARVRVPVPQHARPGRASPPRSRPTSGCRCRSKGRAGSTRPASWCAGRTSLVAVARLAPGVSAGAGRRRGRRPGRHARRAPPRHQPRLGRTRRRRCTSRPSGPCARRC